VSGVKGALCAFSFTAGHVWPYKLVMHLLKLAVSRGINLQTHTPVTNISESPSSDGFYTITTSRGSVKAKKIVFATNAYTAGIAPQFTNKIVPVRGMCSRITAHPASTPVMTNTMSIRYGPQLYDYLIPRADGSIVVGGAKQMFWFQDPKEWYGITDDSTLIEPAKNYFDGLMQRQFKGWEDSGAKTDQVWTGSPYPFPIP
jgi:glycine/D-amino acid oxidase-like deaminating enzyme